MSLNSWLSCLHFLSVLSTCISCHAPLPFYLLISCLTSSYMKSLGESVVIVASNLDVRWISRTSNSQSSLWLAAVILVSYTSWGGKTLHLETIVLGTHRTKSNKVEEKWKSWAGILYCYFSLPKGNTHSWNEIAPVKAQSWISLLSWLLLSSTAGLHVSCNLLRTWSHCMWETHRAASQKLLSAKVWI